MNELDSASTIHALMLGDAAAETPVRLALIMPVFENWGDTIECLGMLAAQTSNDFHLYLADDGSTEPPPEAVSTYGFATYIRKEHSGFAATCNAAVEIAHSAGYSHVLLLNNDTAFGPSFIQMWLTKITFFPESIMSPMIYIYDQPNSVWFSGGKRSITVPFFRYRTKFTKQTSVDILTGCVLLVPMQKWISLGGFNENYVTYYEDFDFMLRAKDEGFSAYLVAEPELHVLHKVSRTALRRGKWNRTYRMTTSRLLFINHRYDGGERIACLCLAFPHLLIEAFLNLPEIPNLRLLHKAIKQGFATSLKSVPSGKIINDAKRMF